MKPHDCPEACVESYFHGLYAGDISALRRAFHPRARLTGVVRGESYERELEDYLALVKSRVSPEARAEVRAMRVVSIERVGNIAMVRASVPMLGFQYVDFLALVCERGEWSIVHKNFTNTEG